MSWYRTIPKRVPKTARIPVRIQIFVRLRLKTGGAFCVCGAVIPLYVMSLHCVSRSEWHHCKPSYITGGEMAMAPSHRAFEATNKPSSPVRDGWEEQSEWGPLSRGDEIVWPGWPPAPGGPIPGDYDSGSSVLQRRPSRASKLSASTGPELPGS